MASFPQVPSYKDNDILDANTLNDPIRALAARTDYNNKRIQEITSNDINASTQYAAVFKDDVGVGSPVYYEKDTQLHAQASANITSSQVRSYQFADSSAYVLGLRVGAGHVLTQGKYTYVDALSVPLATGEVLRPGPYYLAAEVGKITASPKGVAIFIGVIRQEGSSYVIHVNITIKDMWEAHLHEEYFLTESTAGTHTVESGTHHIQGYQDDAITGGTARLLVRGASTAETVTVTVVGADITTATLTVTSDKDTESSSVSLLSYNRWVAVTRGTLEVMLVPASEGTAIITNGLVYTITPERCVGWRPHIETVFATLSAGTNTSTVLLTGTAVPGSIVVEQSDTAEVTVTVANITYTVAVTANTNLPVVDGLFIRFTNYEAVTAGDAWEATFADEAPGAKFVYNIEADVTFSSNYPITPSNNLVLDLNGVNQLARGSYSETEGSYIAGFYGIYWYHDAEGKAPMPIDSAEHNQRILRAYTVYTRVGDAGIVTSIKTTSSLISLSKQGQPVPQGQAAVGDIEIKADLDLQTLEGNEPGYQVIKRIADGTAITGPVVEAITSNEDTITVTNIEGTVNIDITSSAGVKGVFDDSILLNARHSIDNHGMFPYVELLPYVSESDPDTGVLYKMVMPYTLSGEYSLSVYLTLFGSTGTSATQTAPVDITVGVLKDYYQGTGTIPQPVTPIEDADITEITANPVTFSNYTANDPFLYHNDPAIAAVANISQANFSGMFGNYALTRGDIVTVKVKRAVGTYPGSVGILRAVWGLTKKVV